MFALNTATWITIALLTPFGWGMALLVLALLGDVATSWRRPVQRLFDWLAGTRSVPPGRRTWRDAA